MNLADPRQETTSSPSTLRASDNPPAPEAEPRSKVLGNLMATGPSRAPQHPQQLIPCWEGNLQEIPLDILGQMLTPNATRHLPVVHRCESLAEGPWQQFLIRLTNNAGQHGANISGGIVPLSQGFEGYAKPQAHQGLSLCSV